MGVGGPLPIQWRDDEHAPAVPSRRYGRGWLWGGGGRGGGGDGGGVAESLGNSSELIVRRVATLARDKVWNLSLDKLLGEDGAPICARKVRHSPLQSPHPPTTAAPTTAGATPPSPRLKGKRGRGKGGVKEVG